MLRLIVVKNAFDQLEMLGRVQIPIPEDINSQYYINKGEISYGDFSFVHMPHTHDTTNDDNLKVNSLICEDKTDCIVRLTFNYSKIEFSFKHNDLIINSELNLPLNQNFYISSKNKADRISELYLGNPPALAKLLKNRDLFKPKEIWSMALNNHFKGCLTNLFINEEPLNINAVLAVEKDKNNVSFGCNYSCVRNIEGCGHPISFKQNENKLKKDAKYFEFKGSDFIRISFKEEVSTEAEEISFWFLTKEPNGFLVSTMNYREEMVSLQLSIIDSSLKIFLNFGNGPIIFRQGDNLSDGSWHYLLFKRYGDKMEIQIDDRIPESYSIPFKYKKVNNSSPHHKITKKIHKSSESQKNTLNEAFSIPTLNFRAIDIGSFNVLSNTAINFTHRQTSSFRGKIRKFVFNNLNIFDTLINGGPTTPVKPKWLNQSGYDIYEASKLYDIRSNIIINDVSNSNQLKNSDNNNRNLIVHGEVKEDNVFALSTKPYSIIGIEDHNAVYSKDGSIKDESKYEDNSLLISQPVTFNTAESFVTLPKPVQDVKMNIYIRFRTISPNGIIFYYEGIDMEFICIELVDGLINYVFNFGAGPQFLKSNTLHRLDDNNWHEVTISKTTVNDHVLIVDFSVVKTMSQDTKYEFFEGNSGTIYVGGVPEQILNFPPGLIKSNAGYQGCLASLNINGWEPDLLVDSLFKFEPPFLEPGCNGPKEQCLRGILVKRDLYSKLYYSHKIAHENDVSYDNESDYNLKEHYRNKKLMRKRNMRSQQLCHNEGKCIQHWNTWSCDCKLTGYDGEDCSQYSNASYNFGVGPSTSMLISHIASSTLRSDSNKEESGIISYYFPTYDQTDSKSEFLAIGFATLHQQGEIMSVRSSQSNDYIDLSIINGNVRLKTDLGMGERILTVYPSVLIHIFNTEPNSSSIIKNFSISHASSLYSNSFADGRYHVINYERIDNNLTLSVDHKYMIHRSFSDSPARRENPPTFDSIAEISLGGNSIYNSHKRKRDIYHLEPNQILRFYPKNGKYLKRQISRTGGGHFKGILSAASFNGLMILDEVLKGSSNTFVEGRVEKVVSMKEELKKMVKPLSHTKPIYKIRPIQEYKTSTLDMESTTLISGYLLCTAKSNFNNCSNTDDSKDEDRLVTPYYPRLIPTTTSNIKINLIDDEDGQMIRNDWSGSGYIDENIKYRENQMDTHFNVNSTLSTYLHPQSTKNTNNLEDTMSRDGLSYLSTIYNYPSNIIVNSTIYTSIKPGFHKDNLKNNITKKPYFKVSNVFFNKRRTKIFIIVCSLIAILLVILCCIALCCCIGTINRRRKTKKSQGQKNVQKLDNKKLDNYVVENKCSVKNHKLNGEKVLITNTTINYTTNPIKVTENVLSFSNPFLQYNPVISDTNDNSRLDVNFKAKGLDSLNSSKKGGKIKMIFSKSEERGAVYQNLTTQDEDYETEEIDSCYNTLSHTEANEDGALVNPSHNFLSPKPLSNAGGKDDLISFAPGSMIKNHLSIVTRGHQQPIKCLTPPIIYHGLDPLRNGGATLNHKYALEQFQNGCHTLPHVNNHYNNGNKNRLDNTFDEVNYVSINKIKMGEKIAPSAINPSDKPMKEWYV
ncbi:uncharacterized protein LOC135923536 isoform X1 [Gordionus sp. m RMFG-2023]|uniref:uncharacterized protein LOC135923536 isoform X1 n=1 Tax=Gordionus sp. m RMFG-2023 TaxID=3053472 RepID=UPI0031FC7990